jgi:thiol-disulfide isomerase/thioredoxin
MRTLATAVAALVLAAGTLGFDTSRDPIAHTYHLHGSYEADEVSYADGLDGVSRMDTTAPTGDAPKSRFATNYGIGPNPSCSGNGLLAAWRGNVDGLVTGTLSIEVPAVSSGATVVVDVFADGGGACNEAYVEPVLSATVEAAPGEAPLAVVFSDVEFEAINDVTVQFRIVDDVDVTVEDGETGTTVSRSVQKPNEHIRLMFDAAEYDGTVTFECIPRRETDDTCEW